MESTKNSKIINSTIQFVKEQLEGNDASHDWQHIERVWKLSKTIGKKEGIKEEEEVEIIELGALLHDIMDYKYSNSDSAGKEATKQFLLNQNYPLERLERVVAIVEGVGFKNELDPLNCPIITKELAIVQDADRLDAMGAIGIARCFTFGGAKNRSLYDPSVQHTNEVTKEEYTRKERKNNTSINHFYEKLLLLKDKMKTESGRKLAQERHDYMLCFLNQFKKEWEGLV
eukprot:TRINITY_DN2111_c0_g1_i4.p1 TRINITY_DN2111_c0_g1~~TRINITY_DN2111_c0_g1_i4.p1  ORF type:complete len:229 (+),score=72.06 TRINITY_DN2111_c0_g1_i4:222-908(+)